MSTTFEHLPLSAVVSSLTNPRKTFDQAKLAELASSIKASGVHQPILVRPLPGERVADTDRAVTHEIISGERRYRASLLAGWASIPAMICSMTDDQVLETQVVENLQRDDLTDLEEADGYQTLMQTSNLNADQVAAKIGKSASYVRNKLRLLGLCTEARDSLRSGEIDYSRALLLATIPDHTLQIKALQDVSRKGYDGDCIFGVRSATSHVSRTYRLRLDKARFDQADAALLPQAGACKACHKRTGADPDLFAQSKSADLCLDPPCYQRKEDAHAAAVLAVAHASGCTVIEGREAKALMPNSWGFVEGYLRLDNVADSPTDKPLRELLGEQIAASGAQITLLANPHKEGDLIALLPTATVTELLKAIEHKGAAKKIETQQNDSKKAEAKAAKAKAKAEYEQAWRDMLLERTWDEIEDRCTESKGADSASLNVLRHIAQHYAQACNTDRAKRLCQLLGLGKVAPKNALLDYVRETRWPQNVLQLLVMAADVEYQPYWEKHYPGKPPNTGLMLIADDYHVDIDAIKLECKAATRAKVAKPSTANAHAAQDVGSGVDGAVPKLKRKTSASEAKAQIAAAMQAQGDTNPGADAQGNDGAVEQPVADVAADAAKPSLAVDTPVVVTSDTSRLPITQHKWAGKQGVITQKVGDRAWMVSFRGRNGGLCSFDQSELSVVPYKSIMAELPAGLKPKPGQVVAYRGPNGESWSGRGLRPRWLTALVEDGRAMEDFKVAA